MGIFDKFKDIGDKAVNMAGGLANSVKNEYEKAKVEAERKKSEKEAYIFEMEQKASSEASELIHKILNNYQDEAGNIVSGIGSDELKKFTKEFYEKMVLPGSKASLSCIKMYPYIDEKEVKKIKKSIPDLEEAEVPLLYIKDSEKQEFLLGQNIFYFKVKFREDEKFWCRGKIPICNINLFYIANNGTESQFNINGIEIARIKICSVYLQDFMSLNEYWKSLRNKDFEILPEEIDRLIQQKIGKKIYEQVKKYMIYDDELIMYYAGGLDSLLAVDYIACTTRQIIIVDREAFGATSNIKQFYYEDITSMATEQNSKADSLLGYVIDTALTAAFKLCDLIITVAGSANKINTLYTVEAQRVIAIYHEFRKKAKESTQTVHSIVQQNEPNALDMLEKLAQLKDKGILSEEEFQEKKSSLLAKI